MVSYSCEKAKHTIIFKNGKLDSQILIPPSGCYKTRFIANGNLDCETKLDLFMDHKKTNFAEHIILFGNYDRKEIYHSDWYQNTMQIKIHPEYCIVDSFEIKVEFFD